MAVRSRPSALPEPAGSACLEKAPCDTGYAIRTAQVTGLFDLSPSSVPSREVHERSTAGTSQVSKRPAETGAAFCRPSGPRWRGLLCWRGSPHEVPRRQPARFPPPSMAIPRYQQVLATARVSRGSRGPCGPDRRPASDLLYSEVLLCPPQLSPPVVTGLSKRGWWPPTTERCPRQQPGRTSSGPAVPGGLHGDHSMCPSTPRN